jgi:putative tryptophan/tyrosine transport system substrate-binding protein
MDRRGSRMTRRQFVVSAGVVGVSASAGLLAGCSGLPWQASRVARIGFLAAVTPTTLEHNIQAFRQGLADRGYVEGQNVVIEWRFAEGTYDRVPALAAELVSLPVDAIVVAGSVDARVASEATNTIPIVVAGSGTTDLVEDGLAASLSRPGGNVTGLNNPSADLDGKRLQLIMEAVPGVSRVAVLSDANTGSLRRDLYEAYAQALGVQVQLLGVADPGELKALFEAAAKERADALSVRTSPLTTTYQARILTLAAEHRLPAMYGTRRFVDEGGLMSYQARITDLYYRAAYFVDRILKGAKPADLPLEQPMTYEFVVNLKTARELGLTFPDEIMLQVTEVIQ